LEVHVAESHLTVGLNLMRCREKAINPGRKRRKKKKNNVCVDVAGKDQRDVKTIEQQSNTADVFVW
jgi:hypothetical protein